MNKPDLMSIYRTLLLLLLPLTALTPVRAQDAAGILEQVRREYAPDKRVAVFEIKTGTTTGGDLVLSGQCDDPEAVAALERKLRDGGIAFGNRIRTLPDSSLGERTEALVTLSSVNLRTAPAHAAELGTQAILGTPLRVLESRGGWYRVQTPDRYICWVDGAAVALRTPQQMQAWRQAPRRIYTGYLGFVYSRPDTKSRTVSDLVLGSILETTPGKKATRKFLPVTLPDGREGYVLRTETEELGRWAHKTLQTDGLEREARRMTGVPYLWGGTSVKGVDCSGFVKTAYFANGVILARDASQQALTGDKIAPEAWRTCRKGDLLFFGNPQTGRVTHVAMYLSDGRFIHSAGRVKINSIDPSATDYLDVPYLSASRIATRIGTPGITAVSAHSWYFDQPKNKP